MRRDMRNANRFIMGQHLAVCDICGTVCYSSSLRKQYNGLLACDRSVNNCFDYKDVFDKPIKLPKTIKIDTIRQDTYIPTPVVNDTEL